MTTLEKLKNYLKEIEKNDRQGKKINSFLQINPNVMKEAKLIDEKIKKGEVGKLAGKIIAVKSNINVRGLNASCASRTLENYKSTYDATVVKKIKEQDGLIIGMTNMDEFACGSSGETSAFGPTRNPRALELIPGGSSSGSATAVSAGFCDMALGSDTGGSIRNPASHCGVVGVKPSYSYVSRYGLIDLSMSLDQIGPLAKNVLDVALLLDVIKGKDERDAISQESKEMNLKQIEKIPKDIRIGILDFPIKDKRIQKLIEQKIKEANEEYNWKIKRIKVPHLELAIATYYPLVYVEFFSATRKFDGRRYGKKIERVAGEEVLRRILGGSEISKAEHAGRYYYLALKAKSLIEEEFSKVFKNVDCVVSPTVPRLPHKIGEKISVEEMYAYDALTCPSNLAGNCAVSIPAGEIFDGDSKSTIPHPPTRTIGKEVKSTVKNETGGIPVGMQIICDKFEDEKMLRIARGIEKM